MAVSLTDGGGSFLFCGLNHVRNSSGIPYYLSGNGSMYKGDGVNPTSFGSALDDGNKPPVDSSQRACGMCLLSSTTIGVIYNYSAGKTQEVRYETFNLSTDTWNGVNETVNVEESNAVYMNIIADQNGVPHVIYNDSTSAMGSNYATVYYKNRVGGSWNARVEVEGAGNLKNCGNAWLALDNANNAPRIAYTNSEDVTLTVASTTLNNPTSFTLTDVDTSAAVSGIVGCCFDSAGDFYVAYKDSTTGNYSLWDAASSTTRDSGNAYQADGHASVAAVGTDIYLFYCSVATDQLLRYDVFNGTSWSGPTTLYTPPSGADVWYIRAGWDWEFNYGSDGTNYSDSSGSKPEIDVISYHTNSSPNTQWHSLSLVAPAAFIAKPPRVISQAIRGSEM